MSANSSPPSDRGSSSLTPLSQSRNRRKSVAGENAQAIKVLCRFRPVKQVEIDRYGQSPSEGAGNFAVDEDRGTVESNVDFDRRSFTFDRIFGTGTTQRMVFESVQDAIESVLEGFNGTVLAYGQTSSGKTHTMEGPTLRDDDMQGVIPRMVDKLFSSIAEKDENIVFTISVSYFEVYCERIRDLLNPDQDNLRIRELRNGFVIQDITEVNVVDREGIISTIETGKSYRASAATLMNAESSRSHSILSIQVNQHNSSTGRQRKGKIFLVDLAGSEKISKTGAKGVRLEEAKNINKSLTALGMVINALCDGSSHVPYRDSKLTRILQDSLGGNSKTTLIICCAPEERHAQETISTLRFGERAKRIKNNAKINEEVGIPELKQALSLAQKEIEVLSGRLKQYEDCSISTTPFTTPVHSPSPPPAKESTQDESEIERQYEKDEKSREDALRIVELEELLEKEKQLLKQETDHKMLIIAESDALKVTIATLEEKLVELETKMAENAPTSSTDNDEIVNEISIISPSENETDINITADGSNIEDLREESLQLQEQMSSEIEALESSLLSRERETKSAKAAAADYADKYARLKDEHDKQILQVIEKLSQEQHARIDAEDRLESVQQQLWSLQPTKGEGLFGKLMNKTTPKKVSQRERDLLVDIEDLNSKIFQLEAAIETAKVSHRIVIDTKENVTRSLLQKNVTLSQERDTLQSRVDELEETVAQLTSLLRTMQKHHPIGSDTNTDQNGMVNPSGAAAVSLRGGHGHIINRAFSIKGGGGGKKSDVLSNSSGSNSNQEESESSECST